MRRDRQLGFTLIEVLVSLVIAGLALTALMDLTSTGLRLSNSSTRISREAALARSALQRFGTELPVAPGVLAGELAEGFRWRSDIQLADPSIPPDILQPAVVTVTDDGGMPPWPAPPFWPQAVRARTTAVDKATGKAA